MRLFVGCSFIRFRCWQILDCCAFLRQLFEFTMQFERVAPDGSSFIHMFLQHRRRHRHRRSREHTPIAQWRETKL